MKADTTKHHCDYRIEKEYNTTTVHSDMNAAMRQRYEATFLPYFLKVFPRESRTNPRSFCATLYPLGHHTLISEYLAHKLPGCFGSFIRTKTNLGAEQYKTINKTSRS
jgi:hypothetical protein